MLDAPQKKAQQARPAGLFQFHAQAPCLLMSPSLPFCWRQNAVRIDKV
jgi:hypothetical protein